MACHLNHKLHQHLKPSALACGDGEKNLKPWH